MVGAVPTDDRETRRRRELTAMRGLLLGLALGESVRGAGAPRITSGAGAQLAAFTVEGLIRAEVRYAHRGIVSRPALVARSYARWAWVRDPGSDAGRAAAHVVEVAHGRPDGWLVQVPGIAMRSASAPATQRAIAGWSSSRPRPTTSAGWHALVRALPLLAIGRASLEARTALAVETAALTHGDPSVAHAIRAAAPVVDHLSRADVAGPALIPAGLAETAGVGDPADDGPQGLARRAPDGRAVSVLAAGLAALMRCPEPDDWDRLLGHVAAAPLPTEVMAGVGAVAGALFGTAHGVEAIPVGHVGRLDVAWALDTLARDLVDQVWDEPGGGAYIEAADPAWWVRYPGG